ncbi:hypothetical protein DCAR_0101087 [Daucus carota subsp. sativus]|uniref:Lactoylglutathione lyase n=1 Tax=Daucus carota subsp. sativus TaxID=79200 RepID=A0AAF1AJ19_DAUCS|nr:hypothetical protein DCAR_0101087 [Daucus carota subsp. sativus]
MFRIKDLKVFSFSFQINLSSLIYPALFSVRLLKRLDFLDIKFSLYFPEYEEPASTPKNPAERTTWTFSKKASIELTRDPIFKYHNGNSDPRGLGHIGITVDDTYKTLYFIRPPSIRRHFADV